MKTTTCSKGDVAISAKFRPCLSSISRQRLKLTSQLKQAYSVIVVQHHATFSTHSPTSTFLTPSFLLYNRPEKGGEERYFRNTNEYVEQYLLDSGRSQLVIFPQRNIHSNKVRPKSEAK